jgi:hypothetical protein
VGGAIGLKVYENIERDLKKSNWCTYVSNSSLMNVFTRYRENLSLYLRKKEVLATVAEKLKVGSLIFVNLKNEINGIEVEMQVIGNNGEDIYFFEKNLLENDDVDLVSQNLINWLQMYSKMIPYDAKINGVLADQITLDVGKGYPIQIGQRFIIKRPIQKKKHPLLKKIVDWETEIIGEGKVLNISDNQAFALVKLSPGDQKIIAGDWVRLEEYRPEDAIPATKVKKIEAPGTLGVFSVGLIGELSSVDTTTPTGANQIGGNNFGLHYRIEGWVTRHYTIGLELERTIGMLVEKKGNPSKTTVNVNHGVYKITGGYKYLPVGFFYGPQIDFYTGYASHNFDLDVSAVDGFGKNSISGIVMGVTANVPINRQYRFYSNAEFIPFPYFDDKDGIYGSTSSVNAMELEVGVRYQYRPKITIDGGIETLSRKAKFKTGIKEISYKDNRLKVGLSFNF